MEIKTAKCFSQFSVLSESSNNKHRAVLRSECPKFENGSQIVVFVKNSFDEEVSGVEKCLYEDCKEGELVIGVRGNDIFSFSLEDGELKVVCPSDYDFQLLGGELIVSKKV